jgi:predicted enzyme related to lactoylglutathione lyase
MPKINAGKVVWLGVVVKDMEAQLRFYGDVLGLEVIEAEESWAHLDLGSGHLLELLQLSGEPPADKKGFRPGFQVKDIEAAREELISRGAKPMDEIEGGAESGGRWCSFRDPEGNYFEIKQVMRPPAKKTSAKRRANKSAKKGGARKSGK